LMIFYWILMNQLLLGQLNQGYVSFTILWAKGRVSDDVSGGFKYFRFWSEYISISLTYVPLCTRWFYCWFR
jgi:hypothetical protein